MHRIILYTLKMVRLQMVPHSYAETAFSKTWISKEKTETTI